MSLPFQVEFEPPGRADLRQAAHSWWVWAALALIVAAACAAVFVHMQRRAVLQAAGATLVVSSSPSGATVDIDGRAVGATPIQIPVEPGEHQVSLLREGFAASTQRVDVAPGEARTVSAELWLRSPTARRLRPTFPGATVVNAGFLADGGVVLTVAVPPQNDRQLWLVDGTDGLERLGPPDAPAGLAVTGDGARYAYLGHQTTTGATPMDGRLTEAWVGGGPVRPHRIFTLPAGAADERFVDLAWAPDGRHLLAVSRLVPPGGGQRSRLLVLDADSGDGRELVTLPSEVVPGSYAWSPDGGDVALLARVGQLTSLCTVVLATGEFRYLADLGRDDASPLPFAPITWTPDGRRLAFAAPTDERSRFGGWLFGSKPGVGLFAGVRERAATQRLGGVEGQSPGWRSDGTLVTLARPKNDRPIVLRVVSPDGSTADVAELPVNAAAVYAARWDLERAQAIVAIRGAAGFGATQPEFWLVRFRPEADR